jgi:hypothetical protein
LISKFVQPGELIYKAAQRLGAHNWERTTAPLDLVRYFGFLLCGDVHRDQKLFKSFCKSVSVRAESKGAALYLFVSRYKHLDKIIETPTQKSNGA